VLVLDYLKRTRRVTPEIQMKAEEYINVGYQRLLNFEVRDTGGFEWYGNPPANIILSAIGLLEFTDMSKVFDVDTRVIDRDRAFIYSKQAKDGSWDVEGSTAWSWPSVAGKFVVTAYVTWSLVETGDRGEQARAGVDYLREHLGDAKDNAYALALAANAMAAWDPKDDFTNRLLSTLDGQKKEDAAKGSYYWGSEQQTVCYASGDYASVETTALVAMAMMKTGQWANTVNKALTHLVKTKDASGTWGSTSATILSLKALLQGMGGTEQKGDVTLTVSVNGKEEKIVVTPQQSDVMRVFDLGLATKTGDNQVLIRAEGEQNMMYQIVGRYYLPWDQLPEEEEKPLDIELSYDRTELAKDDILTATCKLTYNGKVPTFMICLDLGVPPGFATGAEDFIGLLENKKIDKYSLTERQITVYLGTFQPGQVLEFSYQLRAKYPIKAKTPKSTAYEYYTPDHRDEVEPIEIEVK